MSSTSIEPGTFAVFASKWTLPVASALRGRVVRFSVLRSERRDISQKMLSNSLKLLERQGLVQRRHYPVIPPGVEYRLTEAGEQLLERLEPLGLLIAGARERIEADGHQNANSKVRGSNLHRWQDDNGR